MLTRREISEEQSKRIFWVVQTVFSLVLAKSVVDYKSNWLEPFTSDHYVATTALVVVWMTALWSWIDYSYTSIVMPYEFGQRFTEKIRFILDLLIVATYEYQMLAISKIDQAPQGDLSNLLISFAVLFILYAISGGVRMLAHGKRASQLGLILLFAAIYGALATLYIRVFNQPNMPKDKVNLFSIIAAGVLMIAYRIIRTFRSKRKFWIAVDVDGVLANQIEGVLEEASRLAGRKLTYNDITDWRFPLNESKNIADVIHHAQENRRYITSMPVHRDAVSVVGELYRKYKISIVTARPPACDAWTKAWLDDKGIVFDEYINSKEGKKQDTEHESQLLIDDYLGNIKAFLEKSDGKAILFMQPWSQDTTAVSEFLDCGRLLIVKTWGEVPPAIQKLLK